jgi:flagellar motor switch protein FliN
MSNAAGSQPRLSLEAYQKAWMDSFGEVLRQIASAPFQTRALAAGETQRQDLGLCHAVLSVGPPLAGEQVISVPEHDALILAQLLMGEPATEGAALDDGHREAFAELVRQIAGSAAMALGQNLNAEIALSLTGMERPVWAEAAAEPVRFQLSSTVIVAPLSVSILLSPGLKQALESADEKLQEVKSEPSLMPAPREPNLEFLRDVELQVTLRFGKREILLREILELTAGAVVELEQRIDEPVELLVGEKVIARGEVVVVDGNYGLRVTEVVGPAERVQCLRH